MKILEINTEKTWRGGERQTLYTCRGLMEAGCEVTLLCRGGYPLSKRAQEKGVPIVEVSGNSSIFSYLRKHGEEYDILHSQTAKAQSFAVLANTFHDWKIVYTRRVDFRLRDSWFTTFKYQKTTKLVAISHAIKSIMEEKGHRDISVIPSVVVEKKLDTNRARKMMAQLNPDKKKVLATVAAMVPHKDPLTMVAAIKELKAMRDDFIFLHFGEGELKGELEKAINLFNLQDTYHLMGYMDNVEDFYAVFDVFVMSSQEEGLGSSVLDAFLYKVPVASTDAGGLRETVEGRGLLSPKKNSLALAQNINKLLDDNDLVSKLTETAYREVKEKYSLQHSTQEYLEIFRGLIGS